MFTHSFTLMNSFDYLILKYKPSSMNDTGVSAGGGGGISNESIPPSAISKGKVILTCTDGPSTFFNSKTVQTSGAYFTNIIVNIVLPIFKNHYFFLPIPPIESQAPMLSMIF